MSLFLLFWKFLVINYGLSIKLPKKSQILILVKFQLIFDSFYPEGVECGKFLLIGNPTWSHAVTRYQAIFAKKVSESLIFLSIIFFSQQSAANSRNFISLFLKKMLFWNTLTRPRNNWLKNQFSRDPTFWWILAKGFEI